MVEKISTHEGKWETWEARFVHMEADLEKTKEEVVFLKSALSKVENLPKNLGEITSDIVSTKKNFDDLSSKAETMNSKLNEAAVLTEEFNKVKAASEANTSRIDKILKDEKILNLLISNLPDNIQNIHGFTNFAYHELNVER